MTHPNLNHRLKMLQLVNPLVRLPKTKSQIMNWFTQLMTESQPENLAEGYFPYDQTQILAKLEALKGCWEELELMMGRKVTETEISDYMLIKKLARRKNVDFQPQPPAA